MFCGVGVLGVDALLHVKGHIRGLTPSSSIWLVAAMAMAVGAGLYFLAIYTTFLSAYPLGLLAPGSPHLEGQAREPAGTSSDPAQNQ